MNSQFVEFAQSTNLVSRDYSARKQRRRNIIIVTSVVLFIALIGIFLISVVVGIRRGDDTGYEKRYINYAKLPKGFEIDYWCKLPTVMPRQLAVAHDRRIVFAGTKTNKVLALLDQNHNGRCDEVIALADDLVLPMGVALHNDNLYILDTHTIYVIRNIFESLQRGNWTREVVYDKLPVRPPYDSLDHPPSYLAFDNEGFLYVQIGVPWNENDPDWTSKIHDNPLHGSLLRFTPPNYNAFKVVATGLRNSGGFTIDDRTDKMWFTDNGRDKLNVDTPPDELNVLSFGSDYGYPCCHGCCLVDPDVNKDGECPGNTTTPALALDAHAAALGLAFNQRSKNFPPEYSGDLFIAEHGSALTGMSFPPTGYRIARVRMDPDYRVPLSYETFADFSFAQSEVTWNSGMIVAFGRMVDIKFLSDGSMIASDDAGSAIYRIHYER